MDVGKLSGLILAGGKSRRLGRDKALLEFEGIPLVERAVRTLAPIFREVIVATARPGDLPPLPGVRVVRDIQPEKGSVGGLYTGLAAARGAVFACACDMPFLDERAVRGLIEVAGGARADVVIPSHDGFLQPLHAVYAPSCAAAFRDLIDNGGFRIIDAFEDLRIHAVDSSAIAPGLAPERIFLNINTPADLSRALEMVGAGHGR